jgi:hypothetical protein
MRSSEPIQAPLRWLASGVAGLLAALLAACTAVPAPVGDRFLPDCAVAGLQGEASRRSEFETLRRNVEAGALQRVAALPGPATCLGQVDAGSIHRLHMPTAAPCRCGGNRASGPPLHLRFGPRSGGGTSWSSWARPSVPAGIDWRRDDQPAADGSRSVATVYRGDLCNCQARVGRDEQAMCVLTLRSAASHQGCLPARSRQRASTGWGRPGLRKAAGMFCRWSAPGLAGRWFFAVGPAPADSTDMPKPCTLTTRCRRARLRFMS